MKNLILCSILLLVFSGLLHSQETANNNIVPAATTIDVLSSPDLYDLAVQWAWEFNRQNPTLKINVISNAKPGDILAKNQNLGILSADYIQPAGKKSFWEIVVGRDVIVPVINTANPFFAEINRQGVTPDALAKMLEKPESLNWNTLLKTGNNIPVSFYNTGNELINNKVAAFLNINSSVIPSSGSLTAIEMILAIQKDPNALGFCKLTDIIDHHNQTLVQNIALLPIDKNGNGKIDYMEEIYDNLNTFTRGVWVGKYPKALCSNIYCVASAQPENETESAFLYWILTDGQKLLNQYGYSSLVLSERQMQLDKLNDTIISSNPPREKISLLKLFLILAGFAVGIIILMGLIQLFRSKKPVPVVSLAARPVIFDENTVNIPKGLFFDKTHTWAFMDENGVVKVGIDDFLQHITGEITRVEMKKPGEIIKKGDKLLSIIQKGKQLHIYAPVSGTIKANNEALLENSSLLNSSPFENGWIYLLEPLNWLKELQFLSMAEKYKMWLKNEFTRLKDFISITIPAKTHGYSPVVLQDGGEIKDSLLSDFGPEVWEDFQTKFIDLSR